MSLLHSGVGLLWANGRLVVAGTGSIQTAADAAETVTDTLLIPGVGLVAYNATLLIPGAGVVGPTTEVDLVVAPTITTTALDPLQVGVAFSQQLVATGDEPITWTGTVPDGLTLSSAGLLEGTPTTAGAYSFTVTATNAGGSDDQLYEGTVEAAAVEVTETPAGRSRRRSRKYVVTIDGQDFITESLEQAQALLDRAKALAVTQAQERAQAVVEQAIAKARRVGSAKVRVKAPTISAPAELSSQVDAIRQLYRDAAMAAEVQVLLAIQAERDDEEVLLLSL